MSLFDQFHIFDVRFSCSKNKIVSCTFTIQVLDDISVSQLSARNERIKLKIERNYLMILVCNLEILHFHNRNTNSNKPKKLSKFYFTIYKKLKGCK